MGVVYTFILSYFFRRKWVLFTQNTIKPIDHFAQLILNNLSEGHTANIRFGDSTFLLINF